MTTVRTGDGGVLGSSTKPTVKLVEPLPEPLPCREHFPDGWPSDGAAVGCEHGTWTRDQSA